MTARRVLVVDNHDSFVHTLVGYLRELGAAVSLVEADTLTAREIDGLHDAWDAIVISPGPGTPQGAGASIDVVRAAADAGIPLLGVCLGHQAIAVAFGATVDHALELMHGMTSEVHHDGTELYAGLPDPLVAGRYHSLAIVTSSLPPTLAVTSVSASGVIMGISHRTLPLHGVQFHPESVLTEGGYLLLGNWLESIGVEGAADRGRSLHPHRGGSES